MSNNPFDIVRSFKPAYAALMLTGLVPLLSPAPAVAVDSPVVSEAAGGNGIAVTVGNFDNADAVGYQVKEYFLAGDARTYVVDAKLPKDGRWDAVRPSSKTLPFKTRVIVYTPKDAARFNGTVYVEWQNNSGLADAAPDWVHGHVEVTRQGAAYILASVQPIGITTLKAADPWWLPIPNITFPVSDAVRYGSLKHPGNKYSFDIYSQIAQAVHDGNLLGSLQPEHIIGVGESQSASWLTSYINGVQPLANVYDGFLVHSSLGVSVPLSSTPFGIVGGTAIRDDLVPVILFQSETDVQLSARSTRQAEFEAAKFRLWEVAGTAHFDTYGLVTGLTDTGAGEGEAAAMDSLRNPQSEAQGGLMQCAKGINAGPMHWVFNAALHSINRWVEDGVAPAIAPRLETDPAQIFLTQFLADEHGNTRGGIRTPFVDVPLATLTGSGNGPAEGATFISAFCGIFGQTVPFSDEKLAALYPSNDEFVAKFRSAALEAVQSGFLLQEDASLLIDAAENHDVVR